ncbi:MAG: TolC family protein [Acidobacteriota bacterium]|nr:TolC family protein [Acidobacteriota bacterium]
MKTRAILLAAAVIVGPSAAVQAQTTAPPLPVQAPLRLDTLERDTLARHPDVIGATAAVEAARARARQAGLWPNPMIGLDGEDLRTEEAKYGVFVEQEIPLGGRLAAGRRAVLADVDRLEADRERVIAGVRARLRTAWYSALVANRRVEVLDTVARLSVEAVEITEQLFNTGAADRPDVLESEVEAGRARIALAAARNDLVAAARRLSAASGDPSLEGAAAAGSIDTPAPELQRDATIQRILTASPRVLTARAAAQAMEARVQVARRLMSPELQLRGGAAWRRNESNDRPGRDGWIGSFEAGITLPIFNRNQGGIAAALADQRVAAAELSRLELDLHADAHQTFADYLTALRAAEEYRNTLLPRAEEAYRLYLARYREMAAAYPQVLIAQRSLMQLTQEYLAHAEQLWRSVVQLETLLAGPPPAERASSTVQAGSGGGH